MTDVGDPNATRVFQLEILRRFNEGNYVTKEFLIGNKYIEYTKEEDFRSVLQAEDVIALEELEKELQINFSLAKYEEDITTCGWIEDCYYVKNYRMVGLKIRTSKTKAVPETIEKLNKLKYLNLYSNYFRYLPDCW